MNKIIFPLQRQTQGSRVNDLQEALTLFLERGHMLRNDEGACQKLLVALPPERNSPHSLRKFGQRNESNRQLRYDRIETTRS